MESEGLLAPAPEDEGIAALQAYHPSPGQPPLDQQRIDLLLGQGVLAGGLADVDRRPSSARTPEPWVGQIVVHDDLGRGQRIPGPARVRSPGSPGPAPTR